MAKVGNFQLHIDTRQADYVAQQLAEMRGKVPGVLAGAINKTLGKVKTRMVNSLWEVLAIRSRGRILKGTSLRPATKQRLAGIVILHGRSVGAIQFRHSVSKRTGVKMQFKKTDAPIRIAAGFKAVGIKSNQHLFYRVHNSYYRVGPQAHHLPNVGRRMERLKTMYGPSLNRVFLDTPQMRVDAYKVARDSIESDIMNQVDRALGRKKTDRPTP